MTPDREHNYSSPEEGSRLSHDESASQAFRLMEEYKLALSKNPAFVRAFVHQPPGRAIVGGEIPIVKDGLNYRVTYRPIDVDTNGESLSITRGSELGGREYIEIKWGVRGFAYVRVKPWGMVEWGFFGSGKEPEIHTNTRTAVQGVEAFLRELQGSAT